MATQPPQVAPMTDEQRQSVQTAFWELERAGFGVKLASAPDFGQQAVEIHRSNIDPAELQFILQVARAHNLFPFVVRADESQPPMVLMAEQRLLGEPADNTFGDGLDLNEAEETEAVPEEEQEDRGLCHIFNFGGTVAIATDDGDLQTSFEVLTPEERRVALEVAESVNRRVTERVRNGEAIADVFAVEVDTGRRQYEKARRGGEEA